MTWTPSVELSNAQGTRIVPAQTVLLFKRRIFLTGPITDETAINFILQLSVLCFGSKEPVDVIINSPGGDVQAGLAIYDAIQDASVPVNLYCAGRAESIAAVILAGGDEGRRFISPHAQVLIHEPSIMRGNENASTLAKTAEQLLHIKDTICDILSRHTKKAKEEIASVLLLDSEMDASDAVAFGLADAVTAIPV